MNWKKLALALSGALSASVASAQTVTIYGILDGGVEYLSGLATGGHVVRMPALTGSMPSRLGFRGSEDLGNGLKAVFTLEGGFSLDSGTNGQGGRAFGRQSFVGLEGGWGTVTLGRQYTMLFWSVLDADILAPNIYGTASLDSYLPNARADNAIAYRGRFDKVTLGATYSLGRDTVNAGPSPAGTNCPGESATDKTACREWSVLARYDDSSWGVAVAYDVLRGGPGAFAGLTSSSMSDKRLSVNGYKRFGDLKVGAGLVRRDNDGSATTPKSNLWYLAAAYPLQPALVLEGEAMQLRFSDSSNRATLLTARLSYNFSKRTSIYGTVGHVSNDGTLALSVSSGQAGAVPGPGGSQTGATFGIRHAF